MLKRIVRKARLEFRDSQVSGSLILSNLLQVFYISLNHIGIFSQCQ